MTATAHGPAPARQLPTYLSTGLISERDAAMDGELLKQTRSYCPACMRQLDATVMAVHGQVWLYKRCPAHGPSQGLVERNEAFYRLVMNQRPAPQKEPWSLLIPITHRCNLRCSICFVPNRGRADQPARKIARIIDEAQVPWIVMSGGEPTLRQDLSALIRYTRRRGKLAAMNTNGILLADRYYVRRLADAGLQFVLLSFNGAADSIYERINGCPLLDAKRQALQNLVDEHIEIALSPTIVRGVNDDLAPLVELCLDHAPCVTQLRLRGAAHVGRHGSFEPLVMSELLERLAPTVGRSLQTLLEDFDREAGFHSVHQWIMDAVLRTGASRRGELFHWDQGEYAHEPARTASRAAFEQKVHRELGAVASREDVARAFVGMGFHLWYWPDRYNIDLEEIKGHGVLHWHDSGVAMNFYEAILRAGEL